MNEISTQAPDPAEERAIRRRIWDRLVELVNRGISTGSRQLDRIISTGIDSVELTAQIYDIDYVPSPEEHFLRQDPGEQGRMFRPRLMIHITDDEWSLDILMKLRDLGRCVLAGRAVCRDHVLYNAVDFHRHLAQATAVLCHPRQCERLHLHSSQSSCIVDISLVCHDMTTLHIRSWKTVRSNLRFYLLITYRPFVSNGCRRRTTRTSRRKNLHHQGRV